MGVPLFHHMLFCAAASQACNTSCDGWRALLLSAAVSLPRTVFELRGDSCCEFQLVFLLFNRVFSCKEPGDDALCAVRMCGQSPRVYDITLSPLLALNCLQIITGSPGRVAI